MSAILLSGVRILHVHTLPVVSGSGINTLLTMEGSRRSGAEVGLACAPGGKLEEMVRQAGMAFFPIENFVSELSPLKDLHALWQLDRLFARERFDIVHTHNSKAGFLGRLTAWRNRVPILIHTVHGFAFHEAEQWYFRRLYVWLEQLAARRCHQMIAISEPMIEWAEREKIATRDKFVKIYSGIEVERFRDESPSQELKARLGVQPGETVIGMVSKLWEGKGHEVLLQAVAGLLKRGRRLKLLIVGEGALEGYLRQRARQLGIERAVVFTGFWSNVPEITAILDISALPSFYEGMGRVVLEAMAAGKPVVASRVGGIVELVEEGVTGFMVPAGDVEALIKRLDTLIVSPELRQRMGERGASRVAGEHSAAAMVDKIHQVYLDQLRRTGNPPSRR